MQTDAADAEQQCVQEPSGGASSPGLVVGVVAAVVGRRIGQVTDAVLWIRC